MNIVIDQLRCGYGKKIVVNGFSATMASGEILCLLGPNGIGKTTLFKTILGLIPAKGGSVTVDGRNARDYSIAEYARLIGYVTQAHTPPFSYRVIDVVMMGRTAHMGIFGSPGKEDQAIALRCLERLEVSHLAERVYTELSGGERQMVLVARALAQEPAFLMMDEPTSNLDFGNQARVLQNINRLADQGLGIIMTTHHPDHVFQCDAKVALMMRDGSYVWGDAADVISAASLRQAYGIDVAVLQADYDGHALHLCQPLLSHLAEVQ